MAALYSEQQPQGDHLHMISTSHQSPEPTFCGLSTLLSLCQVLGPQPTGLLSFDVAAVKFSLSLAVPFYGHWRAPSILPRIHSATSKIIWEAGMYAVTLVG